MLTTFQIAQKWKQTHIRYQNHKFYSFNCHFATSLTASYSTHMEIDIWNCSYS